MKMRRDRRGRRGERRTGIKMEMEGMVERIGVREEYVGEVHSTSVSVHSRVTMKVIRFRYSKSVQLHLSCCL